MKFYRKRLFIYGERAEKENGGDFRKYFAGVYVITRDGVVKSKLKYIPRKVSKDEDKRGDVRPSDGDKYEEQKPRSDKAVVVSEGKF